MKRGEIYVVDLDPVVGREAGGVRPVVVVSDDVSNVVPVFIAVVPAATAADDKLSSGVLVPAVRSGYGSDLVVLFMQVRALDPGRFPDRPAGTVPLDLMDRIGLSLKVFLDIK